MKSRLWYAYVNGVVAAIVAITVLSCSTTKYVPDGKYLLRKVIVLTEDDEVNVAELQPYIRQKPNGKWFSLLKIPLATYSLAGRDSAKWINRTLKSIGEPPVIYDSLQAMTTVNDLKIALQNRGYMAAEVGHRTIVDGKSLTDVYQLKPGKPYYIGRVDYDIQDSAIQRILAARESSSWTLKPGNRFTVSGLDAERKRITALLGNHGYYRFNKEFIQFTADTVRNGSNIDLTLHLLRYKENSRAAERPHPVYHIGQVRFVSNNGLPLHLRPSVLENASELQEGELYQAPGIQKTYNNLARLSAIRYTNIRLHEREDSARIDCDIVLGTQKPHTLSFAPEGTNTAGDLGAAATFSYQNRNLFHGSELLTVQLRAAYEAITGLEGYANENYIEYGAETKLQFPRFVAPLLSKRFLRQRYATSELSLGYNLQNRPEFHRRLFSAAWRYRWTDTERNVNYKLDLIDLNYIYMPWISATFKSDYLDDASTRNAILRYNYEDLFIMRIGFGWSQTKGTHAVRANVETAGNVLNAAAAAFQFSRNGNGQYTLYNIAYAQYVKADLDYTKAIIFDEHNSLVLHAGLGIAYPYGNSRVLPFEKRYFAGGANSVRGWSVRRLGPGRYKGHDGAIDFINQTGDMRIDLNMEYRTFLFWKINGALFVDAGNIWTIREYDEQPGGQFQITKFMEQLAVAYGLGFRLNFDYFILRFDMGMKAVNPAFESKKEHFPIAYPRFSRDFAFHFAVGLPF